MFKVNHRKKNRWCNKVISAFTSFIFVLTLSIPPQSLAQVQNSLNLPAPGTMVTLSPAFNPTILKGVQIHPDNPLKFDFIVDRGDSKLENDALKAESQKLIKYFLAGMTIPEEDLWVNLNPYEQDKITNQNLGVTEMGRDLLAQDYLLKQLSASLIYPEKDLGKNFWDRVYKKTYELFGRTDLPVNTFNKVWIIPDKAVVYEEGNTAFVMESHMKVMLEEDYLALDNNLKDKGLAAEKLKDNQVKQINNVSLAIIREVILPEIEKEVNEGKNFTQLRQIYNSLVLAAWFKNSLRSSLLGKIYVDKSKVAGVDVDDRAIKDKIYDQYMLAYKKGVYNYIREDYDPSVKKVVPRNYFSGGADFHTDREVVQRQTTRGETLSLAQQSAKRDIAMLTVGDHASLVTVELQAHAMTSNRLLEPAQVKEIGQRSQEIVTRVANLERTLPTEVANKPEVKVELAALRENVNGVRAVGEQITKAPTSVTVGQAQEIGQRSQEIVTRVANLERTLPMEVANKPEVKTQLAALKETTNGVRQASEGLTANPLSQAVARPEGKVPGGIDLNTKKLLNLQTSGAGITPFDFKNINIDLDQLQKNGFDGFVPVIENLVPIQNFQLLFGQNKASTSDSLTSQKLSSSK